MPHLLAENNFITPPSEVEREKSDVTKNRKSEPSIESHGFIISQSLQSLTVKKKDKLNHTKSVKTIARQHF